MATVLYLIVVFVGSIPFWWVARVANIWLVCGGAATVTVGLGLTSLRLTETGERVRAPIAAIGSLIAAEVTILSVAAGLFSALVNIPLIGVFVVFFALLPLALAQQGVAACAKEFWSQERP